MKKIFVILITLVASLMIPLCLTVTAEEITSNQATKSQEIKGFPSEVTIFDCRKNCDQLRNGCYVKCGIDINCRQECTDLWADCIQGCNE